MVDKTLTICSSCGDYDEETPGIVPFQSMSRSESESDRTISTCALTEDEPKSPRTSPSYCETDSLTEDAIVDRVKNTVFGVASNLVQVVVGMRKAQLQDDELSTNSSSIFCKFDGLDTKNISIDNLRSRSRSDSVSIPPEIEMLHMEADLLLESLRFGVTSEKLKDSEYSPEKDREEICNFLDLEYNTSDDMDKDDDEIDDDDDTYSVSSFLTDDDGMKGEIENLGMAVSTLRRDLETFGGNNASEIPVPAVLDVKQYNLQETFSLTFKEIALSIKALRSHGDKNGEDSLTKRGIVSNWSLPVLCSTAIIMGGLYYRASVSTENGFNDVDGNDMLESLRWVLAKKEQDEMT